MKKQKLGLMAGWAAGLLAVCSTTMAASLMADPLGSVGSTHGLRRGVSGGHGAVVLPSAVPPANDAASTLSFNTILQRSRSGIVTPGAAVAVQDSEWALLWASHMVNTNPSPPAPRVDFTQEQVIAVYLGNRPNGCYSVSITDVSDTATARVVTWHENVPAAGAVCPAVISQPIHIIRMPRSDLPVKFQAN